MKKILIIAITLLIMSTFAYAETKIYKQQNIECIKVTEPIVIDGKMDNSWNKAKEYGMYVLNTTNEPLSTVKVRTMYDNNNIYVFFKTKDKDIKAFETRVDGSTCLDDVLEIFLRPANCNWYYNAEINALGTAYTGKNHVGGGWHSNHSAMLWNPSLEYKIFIDGTINNPYDIDKYWTLEAKIPFNQFDELKGKAPKAGDIWTCNFAKYDYSIYLPNGGIELATTCHVDNAGFHQPENYCPLIFK